MWTRIGNPLEEFPEWTQPIDAHDAYSKGAKTSHGRKKWVSEVDGNTWEPGVYGWAEYSELEPQEVPPGGPGRALQGAGGTTLQRAKRQGRGGESHSLPGLIRPALSLGPLSSLGAVGASGRARIYFLERGYFFSNILSEFLKNLFALHVSSSQQNSLPSI